MYDYFLFISYNTHPTHLVLRTDHTDQLSKAADQCCGWDKQRCCDNHHWLCSWSLMYSGLWSLGPTPKGDFHAISSFFCFLPPSSSSSPLWSVVMTRCIMWKPLQSHLRLSLFVKNSPSCHFPSSTLCPLLGGHVPKGHNHRCSQACSKQLRNNCVYC